MRESRVTVVPDLYACILAGGSGQRFWPLSRELSPKQFLSVFGTDSLITQAVRRVLPFVDARSGHALVITNERLSDEIRNHLISQPDPEFGCLRYIVEPHPKNTAPAIALAAAVIAHENPEGLMITLPSDHLLDAGEVWADAVRTAASLAADGYLVTIGIQPTRAETGYGYIRAGEPLQEYTGELVRPLTAAAFVEKPSEELAEAYLSTGHYFWNAGIFVMKAARVLEELRAAGEDGALIAGAAEWVAAHLDDSSSADEARERFSAIEPVSIDVAVMERSESVAVIPADIDWNDVGSLLALEDVAPADGCGMVRVGRGVDIGSSDTVVYSADRLVATLGVDNLIVADTHDATLIARKDLAQDVRLVFEALRDAGAEEVTQPKVSLRPWGSWTQLFEGPGFKIKMLEVKPGTKVSLQRHVHRSEHWIVVAGAALVTLGTDEREVNVNEGVFIPAGAVHRLENRGDVQLKVIEVQVGGYLGEDDLERLSDDWNRNE